MKNILIVDDDPDQAELLALALGPLQHRVHPYSDPIRALSVLVDEGVDLLIADLSMPWLSGQDVIARARIRHPDMQIFLVSGYARGAEVAAREGLRFFAKPLDIDVLRRAVQEVLGGPAPAGAGAPAGARDQAGRS